MDYANRFKMGDDPHESQLHLTPVFSANSSVPGRSNGCIIVKERPLALTAQVTETIIFTPNVDAEISGAKPGAILRTKDLAILLAS
jgi:hypothetical protein